MKLDIARSGNATRQRLGLIAALAALSLLGFFLADPIAQDQAYHRFADQRAWLGIPNFMNVVSNLPFAIVGAWGLARLRRFDTPARAAWGVFFGGVLLVAFGSAYYHWRPDDVSLVWDRLPMTLGFIGLTVALVTEQTGVAARWLLPLGIVIGLGSVALWVATGDLRLYYGVQLMPMVVTICVLLLFRSRWSHGWHLAVAVALYAGAKVTEHYDLAIAQATDGGLSGHPVKHVLAAGATFWVLDMLRVRQRR